MIGEDGTVQCGYRSLGCCNRITLYNSYHDVDQYLLLVCMIVLLPSSSAVRLFGSVRLLSPSHCRIISLTFSIHMLLIDHDMHVCRLRVQLPAEGRGHVLEQII